MKITISYTHTHTHTLNRTYSNDCFTVIFPYTGVAVY